MNSDPSTERRTYEPTIERIATHTADTKSFFLRLPSDTGFAFKPGQFISCLLPIAGDTLIRPYSIASDPETPDLLEICLNLVTDGPGSHYLFGLQPGDTVRFTGPWGTFTLEQAPAAECIFIAEGTGIAPIRPMLRRALAQPSGHPIRLHYAADRVEHLLYQDEFSAAAQAHERFDFEPLLDKPLAADIEGRYITGDADRTRHFYICAVGAIVPQLRDRLRRAGYARRAVQYEKW